MEALFIHISTKLEAIRYGKDGTSGKLLDVSEVKTIQLWRAVAAEFLAQVLFVILGCASAIQIPAATTAGPDYAHLVKNVTATNATEIKARAAITTSNWLKSIKLCNNNNNNNNKQLERFRKNIL
ncbi:aquaporin [Elysia marginata]|uniref:Aquaporin n=1 Tax=Elysia marginata TaxID=1093978 RepID=A0AAV4IWB6_9GAST|nr:aquaporin [Elysia marginata]